MVWRGSTAQVRLGQNGASRVVADPGLPREAPPAAAVQVLTWVQQVTMGLNRKFRSSVASDSQDTTQSWKLAGTLPHKGRHRGCSTLAGPGIQPFSVCYCTELRQPNGSQPTADHLTHGCHRE